VRLTTRDERDTKRTELALLALASQGASILIAGFDSAQAQIAARFAAKTRVPVILLSPLPEGETVEPPAFVLGEPMERTSLAIVQALASHGARAVAPIGGTPPTSSGKVAFVDGASCATQPNQAGTSPFPIDAWRAKRVDALLLLGDAACSSEAIATAVGQKLGVLRAGVGLEGADLASEPSRLPLLVAAAGGFPLRRGDGASPMNGFKKRQGRAPSFWAALGHDAAVLARAAEKTLPADSTDEASEVEKRHRAAGEALAGAEADLWSTAARGFAGKSVIAREISVFEVR
jgi:hypothetical protein